MRKCPFCKQEVKFRMPYLLQLSDGTWSYMHHCILNMTIMITAESKEKILEIWEGKYGEEHTAG